MKAHNTEKKATSRPGTLHPGEPNRTKTRNELTPKLTPRERAAKPLPPWWSRGYEEKAAEGVRKAKLLLRKGLSEKTALKSAFASGFVAGSIWLCSEYAERQYEAFRRPDASGSRDVKNARRDIRALKALSTPADPQGSAALTLNGYRSLMSFMSRLGMEARHAEGLKTLLSTLNWDPSASELRIMAEQGIRAKRAILERDFVAARLTVIAEEAAKVHRAGVTRGQTLHAEAAIERDKWMPKARRIWAKLASGKGSKWSRTALARAVAEDLAPEFKISYRTILRHHPTNPSQK